MRGKRTVVQHRNKCLRSMQRSSVEETSHENALQPGHDCVEPLRECPTVARLEGGEELQEDLEECTQTLWNSSVLHDEAIQGVRMATSTVYHARDCRPNCIEATRSF